MAQSDVSIRSLLLPLEDTHILLPGTVVAEVVGYTTPHSVGATAQPDWLLGLVAWRSQRVPCVAFEVLNGQSASDVGTRARIVVLKAVTGQAGMPYIALRTRSIPRLVNVDRDGLEPLDGDDAGGPGVSHSVLVDGETAVIPDLHYIEGQTHRALFGG